MDDNSASLSPLQILEDVTTNAQQVQSRLLSEILSKNAQTEYLQRYLSDQKRADATQLTASFKRLLPVASYRDIQSDVLRIANGDQNPILCADRVTSFLISSGTSMGQGKLIPYTEEEHNRRVLLTNLNFPIICRHLGDLFSPKQKYFYVTLLRPESKTPAGHPVRTAVRSHWSKESDMLTSPLEATLCEDPHQSLYAQILAALSQNSSVFAVGSSYPTLILRAMRFIEENWQSLCSDISVGSPSETHITLPSVRTALRRLLRAPNPELSEALRKEFSKKSWEGIIQRLWPKAKFVQASVTGSMFQYVPAMEFYCGHLPIVSMFYTASEGFFGLNLRPFCKPSDVLYTLIPTMAFYEFLPIEEKEDQEPVDIVKVELGKSYELVVTTRAGLYRYKMGDIVRVKGFYNSSPMVEFVSRRNAVISVDTEKTDDCDLLQAAKVASRKHLEPNGFEVVDFSACADTSTFPGHYVFFWEIRGVREEEKDGKWETLMEECCNCVEQALNRDYRRMRVHNKSIGALEIRVVSIDTFQVCTQWAVRKGACETQYKSPRCVTSAEMLQILNSRVICSFFSTILPSF